MAFPRSGTATPHRLGVGLLAAAVALWGLALLATLETASARGEPVLLAVFPRGTSETAALASVAGAGGVMVGGSWLANAWHVQGEGPGFAEDLRQRGAVWVLPALPGGLFGAGGCGFGPWGPRAAEG